MKAKQVSREMKTWVNITQQTPFSHRSNQNCPQCLGSESACTRWLQDEAWQGGSSQDASPGSSQHKVMISSCSAPHPEPQSIISVLSAPGMDKYLGEKFGAGMPLLYLSLLPMH